MKLAVLLLIIFMCIQLARYLFTGVILLPGAGVSACRREQPRKYWTYLVVYAITFTLVGVVLCKHAKLL